MFLINKTVSEYNSSGSVFFLLFKIKQLISNGTNLSNDYLFFSYYFFKQSETKMNKFKLDNYEIK